MGGVDPVIAALAPALWIAALAAALLVLTICTLVFQPPPTELWASVARTGIIVLGAAILGSLVWTFFASSSMREQAAERRALELRAGRLAEQALAPGSPLACLDAGADDAIAGPCQKAIFATPANVAAGTSYVAAQFALLGDMSAYRDRNGGSIDRMLLPLRRGLEADPFGFLAHVLAVRDGCTSDRCAPLKLLHDARHVRMNLIARTLDHYVDQYREAWAKLPEVAAGEGTAVPPSALAAAAPAGPHKVKVNIDFPSAASIPAISIMNPEPKSPPPQQSGDHRGTGTDPGNAAHADPVWVPVPAQATP